MSKKLILTAVAATLSGFLVGQYRERAAPWDRAVEVQSSAVAQEAHSYVCPMHADSVADRPGRCPICGMDLVERQPGHGAEAVHDGYPVVRIASAVRYNLGIRTARVERGEMHRRIETIGKITRVDPTARRVMTPPIAGELVHVSDKHDGDPVEQGELLFAVSSPELLVLEKAFQQASLAGERASATVMIPRLREMGLSPEQIAQLQSGAAPDLPAQVYAAEAGHVFARRGKVGEAVGSAFTVFNLGGDYQVVEVTAEIFERQWGWVKEGQDATLTVRGLPGEVFHGKVDRVEPPVGYTTRSLEVRLRFRTDNPGISQSLFAHVAILGQSRHNLLMVPQDAVIRTGAGERVVRSRGDGGYQPVAVVAGEESGGKVEITSGLEEGERVVTSGQFLIDSESSLMAGLRRMTQPGTDIVSPARSSHRSQPSHPNSGPVSHLAYEGRQHHAARSRPGGLGPLSPR